MANRAANGSEGQDADVGDPTDVPEEPDRLPGELGGSAAVPSADALEQRLIGRAGVDVSVPDGVGLERAFARTTDLGIGAHADDLEFAMLVPIGACLRADDRWFCGVTCTDGAGAARSGPYASITDEELIVIRAAEQRAAADAGGYGAMVQLGYSSPQARDPQVRPDLVEDLVAVLEATRPINVYTHNPADKHVTHVAVFAAVIEAIRRLPVEARPVRVVGVEGWRDLDWLPDHEKVVMDATGLDELGEQLAACFPSQIDGGKRYDLASAGRRRANATMGAPRAVDITESAVVAIDLTPLAHNDDLDPATYVVGAIDRFRAEVESVVGSFFR